MSSRDQAPSAAPGLGDVVRDAIEQVKEIARDGVALGKLEAKHAIDIGKFEAKRAVSQATEGLKDIVPRIVVGLAAAALGFVAVVLGLIAIFIGLGEVIPSVAVRLAIFAAFFLVAAASGIFFAVRERSSGKDAPRKERDPQVKLAHPTNGHAATAPAYHLSTMDKPPTLPTPSTSSASPDTPRRVPTVHGLGE